MSRVIAFTYSPPAATDKLLVPAFTPGHSNATSPSMLAVAVPKLVITTSGTVSRIVRIGRMSSLYHFLPSATNCLCPVVVLNVIAFAKSQSLVAAVVGTIFAEMRIFWLVVTPTKIVSVAKLAYKPRSNTFATDDPAANVRVASVVAAHGHSNPIEAFTVALLEPKFSMVISMSLSLLAADLASLIGIAYHNVVSPFCHAPVPQSNTFAFLQASPSVRFFKRAENVISVLVVNFTQI